MCVCVCVCVCLYNIGILGTNYRYYFPSFIYHKHFLCVFLKFIFNDCTIFQNQLCHQWLNCVCLVTQLRLTLCNPLDWSLAHQAPLRPILLKCMLFPIFLSYKQHHSEHPYAYLRSISGRAIIRSKRIYIVYIKFNEEGIPLKAHCWINLLRIDSRQTNKAGSTRLTHGVESGVLDPNCVWAWARPFLSGC